MRDHVRWVPDFDAQHLTDLDPVALDAVPSTKIVDRHPVGLGDDEQSVPADHLILYDRRA
jgi:hypothetical protein